MSSNQRPTNNQRTSQQVLRRRDINIAGDREINGNDTNSKRIRYMSVLEGRDENIHSDNNNNKKKQTMVSIIPANTVRSAKPLTTPPEPVRLQLDDEVTRANFSTPHTLSTTSSTSNNISLGDTYVKWKLLQGGTTTIDDNKRAVQQYVRQTLFSKVKFIICDSELEYTGKWQNSYDCICNYCTFELIKFFVV
jgi:hypothetical protein